MAKLRLKEWVVWVLVPLVVVGGTFWGGYHYRSLEERVERLELSAMGSLVFGQWERKDHSVLYTAESDGFVVVRSHGGPPPAESDFEIMVGTEGNLRSRTRGGEHQGAACPVPRGSSWQVSRGGSSNSGSMDVFWIPLIREN